MWNKCLVPVISLVIVSCASGPSPLSVVNKTTLTEFANVSSQSIGQTVKWGGLVLASSTKKGYSELLVLQHPLNENGKPDYNQQFGGKFIGKVSSEHDFVEGSLITLLGKIDKVTSNSLNGELLPTVTVGIENTFVWQDSEQSSDVSANASDVTQFPERGKWGWHVSSPKEIKRQRQETENERRARN